MGGICSSEFKSPCEENSVPNNSEIDVNLVLDRERKSMRESIKRMSKRGKLPTTEQKHEVDVNEPT